MLLLQHNAAKPAQTTRCWLALPIYALLVAKSGPKVKATLEDGASAGKPPEGQLAMIQPVDGKDGFPALSLRAPGLVIETRNGRARVTAKEASISQLADLLSGQFGPSCSRYDRPGRELQFRCVLHTRGCQSRWWFRSQHLRRAPGATWPQTGIAQRTSGIAGGRPRRKGPHRKLTAPAVLAGAPLLDSAVRCQARHGPDR